MALINWDSGYSVGIEEIDKQHQLLVKYPNELYDALTSGQDKKALGTMISRMSSYAAIHFAKEEHFFDIFGFPEGEQHKDEHDAFEKKVCDFEDDFKAGRQELSKEVMRFLSDWLIHHIKVIDRKYGPFLNERGVR